MLVGGGGGVVERTEEKLGGVVVGGEGFKDVVDNVLVVVLVVVGVEGDGGGVEVEVEVGVDPVGGGGVGGAEEEFCGNEGVFVGVEVVGEGLVLVLIGLGSFFEEGGGVGGFG